MPYRRPISRRVLVHSIEYFKRTGVDQFQQATFDTGITVNNVYVEMILKTTNSQSGEFNEDTLEIFYDYTNSTPNNLTFNELDKVVFEGHEYVVRRKPKYLQHHAEILCT